MAPPRKSEEIIAEFSAFRPNNDAYIFDEIITESGDTSISTENEVARLKCIAYKIP